MIREAYEFPHECFLARQAGLARSPDARAAEDGDTNQDGDAPGHDPAEEGRGPDDRKVPEPDYRFSVLPFSVPRNLNVIYVGHTHGYYGIGCLQGGRHPDGNIRQTPIASAPALGMLAL